MNKHYFFATEIQGWFRNMRFQIIGLTKVHLDFFSPTLILRKPAGLALLLLGLLQFAPACRSDSPIDPGSKPAVADGKAIYRRHCVTCHGADGTLGLNGAGDLTKSVLPLEARVTQIAKGKNLMTAFEGILSSEEIRAVAAYSETLKK